MSEFVPAVEYVVLVVSAFTDNELNATQHAISIALTSLNVFFMLMMLILVFVCVVLIKPEHEHDDEEQATRNDDCSE